MKKPDNDICGDLNASNATDIQSPFDDRTPEEWSKHSQDVQNRREQEAKQQERIASILDTVNLPVDLLPCRQRLKNVLKTGEDKDLLRGVEIMIKLIPIGLSGSLSVGSGSLLASVSKKYPQEHKLLLLVFKKN